MKDLNSARLSLYLNGNFRIENSDSDNLTPSSQKAQALVSLLATDPKGERGRSWLQSKLWSDRGPEQAAASLRQALVQLRKALGADCDILTATRQRVALNLDVVDIHSDGEGDFLEGIDARDPEFETWLSVERSRRDTTAPTANIHAPKVNTLAQAPWTIVIAPSNAATDISGWFEQLFADTLGKHLRELFSAKIVIGKPDAVHENLWVVETDAQSVEKDMIGLRVSLQHPATRQQIWSGFRHVPIHGAPPIEHPDVLRLANEMSEALGDALISPNYEETVLDNPDHMCRKAIRLLFSMRSERVEEADRLFSNAFDLHKRGLYLAWRAQVRVIQKIEKYGIDPDALIESGEEMCRKAMELEPNNSMVLAIAANTIRGLLDDPVTSLELSKRSVLLSPGNPMAWWALSSANVYSGQFEPSYKCAVNARNLAILAPNRFWWDMQQFGTAGLVGRLDEAQKLIESAHAQNPDFKPPMRYLIAYYAHAGREDDAAATAEKLARVEPDFSIERLLRDRDYPASLLHKVPGLELERLGGLI